MIDFTGQVAWVSGALWATSALLWLLALFLYVSPLSDYSGPMAITALVSTGSALLLSAIGGMLLRVPGKR